MTTKVPPKGVASRKYKNMSRFEFNRPIHVRGIHPKLHPQNVEWFFDDKVREYKQKTS
jgi:hypothetical protein